MMLFWGKRSMPLVQLFRKICPLQWNHKGRLVSSEKVFKLVWHSKSNYMTIRSMNLCCGTAEECLSRANRNYLTTWVLKKKRKKKNYFFSPLQNSFILLMFVLLYLGASTTLQKSSLLSWRCGSSPWFMIWDMKCIFSVRRRERGISYKQPWLSIGISSLCNPWLPSTKEFRMKVRIGAGLILESKLLQKWDTTMNAVRYTIILLL